MILIVLLLFPLLLFGQEAAKPPAPEEALPPEILKERLTLLEENSNILKRRNQAQGFQLLASQLNDAADQEQKVLDAKLDKLEKEWAVKGWVLNRRDNFKVTKAETPKKAEAPKPAPAASTP